MNEVTIKSRIEAAEGIQRAPEKLVKQTILRVQQRSYPAAVAYDYFCMELENVLQYVFGVKYSFQASSHFGGLPLAIAKSPPSD